MGFYEMNKIALNAAERIMLKVPTFSGYEYADPRLIHGATYTDVIKAAGDYDAIEIYRFDEQSMCVTDITDEVSLHFTGDVLDNPPLWLRHSVSFGNIVAAERRSSREFATHERSFAQVAL
jgi:hypothetical protein